MTRVTRTALAALLVASVACGGSQGKSSNGDGSGDGGSAAKNVPKPAEPEAVSDSDKKVISDAEAMASSACACSTKACADQHVGELFGFVIEQRGRKASKSAQKTIADQVARQVKCAEGQSVNRAVVGRLLLIAATTAKDWAEEVEKLRDASCDCKNVACSETVLSAFAALVHKLKTVRVTKDEATRAGKAGQVLTNCMKSLGVSQAAIVEALQSKAKAAPKGPASPAPATKP